MSKQAKASNAQKLIHSLIRMVPGAHEENLRTVRKLRAFIQNPEASSPNLENIAAYWGAKIPYGWVPFSRGNYVTQAVPAPGMTPAYLLPLPGQRSLVLGSPEGVDLDGGIWDDAAQRWTNVKDLRILVNTPDGVTCATVESGDFVLVSDTTGPDQETVASAVAILDELEKRILDAQLEDSQKPAPETQEEGLEDE
jgi:hypothetical protein